MSVRSTQKRPARSALAVAALFRLPTFLRGLLSPDGAEGPVCCLSGTEAARDVWGLQACLLTGLQVTLH